MLKLVEHNQYKYIRADGAEFTLKQYRNDTWHTVQVGEIMRVDNHSYKVLDIKPAEVLLELLPDKQGAKL